MTFKAFSNYLENLENTPGRIDITKLLSDLFTKLGEEEIKEASYLLTGGVAASYKSIVFNVAEKMLVRALSMAYEIDLEKATAVYKKSGDIGLATFELAGEKKGKEKNFSVKDIFNHLVELSKEEGEGSQEKRTTKISEVIKSLTPIEAKYYIRIISGSLRLGFSEKTMIDALSWMETGGKSKSSPLMKAYEVVPDIGEIALKVKTHGIDETTKKVNPIVGIPVMPMLSQRLKSPKEMISKMKEVSVEPKFDGLRVLIHYSKSKNILKAFTRNLKDISNMFPELANIQKHLNAEEVILDSEAVGMDPELIKIADFQTTMQRRRKHEIEDLSKKIPITFQVFDLIYADGVSFMGEPYTKRREALEKTVKTGNLLRIDNYEITSDPEKISVLHEKYRRNGLEGIIVKKADSEYVPGRLGWRWVKMKETEASTSGKLSDTVDAVIMGYSSGQGKRTEFGIGQFLAGVVDGEKIKTVTKVGTGLTDEQFRDLFALLNKIKTNEMPKEYEVHKNLTPDFWVKPEVVVELAADDVTVSPNHAAGYALRFPRLVKIRSDKTPKEATTIKELKQIYDLQKK